MSRKRRGRGEGSVYQRADGLWTTSISLGYDGAGKRLRRVLYGASKAEVLGKLKECSGAASPAAGTLGTFLHQWLGIIKPTVEPGTYRPYERHVVKHIVPHVGNVKLAALEAIHIEHLYASLQEAGMSAAMIRKVGTTLTIALNKAVERHSCRYNPALSVKKPKAVRREFQVLAPDEVTRFLAAAQTDRLYALYVLALDAGMRPGELFALTWPDVDFDKGHVMVSKSLEEIAGRLRVKDVKTKKGRRRIDLASFTIDALNAHRRRMLAAGHVSGPVFPNTQGGHLRLTDVRESSFKPILERAKLPAVRLYDLRHTCATLLLLADENPKVVSERLGHSTINLTLDTYTHVLPTMQKRAAQKMNAFLAAGIG
jgi:integrase